MKELPRIAFVVGGESSSAIGVRARALSAKLSTHYNIHIAYRSPRKIVSIASVLNFLLRLRPAAIYVFDISYTGVIAAGLYKTVFRSKLIVETGDAIVELVRSTGSRGKFGLGLTKLLENVAFGLADRAVVRGTFHKELLKERGIEADVIQDGVDTSDFAVADTGELRRQLKLEDFTTIGLVGTSIWSEKLQMCYGWELVETLHLLGDRPVKGIMIGSGTGITHLKARVHEYGLEEKIIFLGQVAYEQLPSYLRLIDICFSTQTNDVVGQVRTTGKLPLYLAAGRYILASRVGEAARVLPEEMLVDYEGVHDSEYPRKLKERIEKILAQPDMLKRASGNIAIAKENFDYAVLAERMKEVIAATIQSERTTESADAAAVPAKSVTMQ